MRFHRLDLNLLVILDHLLQGRTVSETARILSLTQPAISNSLARLRTHFEDELFVSVGRRLEPTPFAKSLADPVKTALEEIERIIITRSDFDPATAERDFTIVCSDYVYSAFLTRVIRRLAEVAPNINLLVLLNSEMTSPLLNEGQADFLITPQGLTFPLHPHVPLFSDDFSCIVWSENKEVGDVLTAEAYLNMRHVSVTLGPKNPRHIEQKSLDMLGIDRRIVVFAPTFNAVADTIIGTPYIATVHSRTARLFAERLPLKVLKAPVPIATFTECLQWHRNKDNDAGTLWLKEFLVSCARDF
ncbi:LysR substrate-binding domain-containing protein [Asticcacaulis taihuensis]|jgi:DNA-binding transcriptional LysR family regulator|uniref:LysR substrate-binding domain-containing protein n=1 Tax=Asticcacaulis taihuensis TaxID=260084 RepID=UPI0026F1FB48|nr:LysR substrate-binding domain-containing protein [Asticcacaulis taihuensis]